MKGHGEKLSRKKEQAISALITEPTIPAAAEQVGVGTVTLWRWLQIPEFQRTYRQARRESVSQAVARLQRVSGEAVEALADVMNDAGSPASSRVSAAKSVLEMALKAVELEDMEARITELEEVLQDEGKHEKKSK